MYLSNIKLWNFRKFGNERNFDIQKAGLDLNFHAGLNVLIGENDSGKTAIIDAIKLVLKTHSFEFIKVTHDDFYKNAERFRIELEFSDLSDDEAKNFTEWLGWKGEGATAEPFLRLIYDVQRNLQANRILPADVKAGVDDDDYQLNAEAKDYLKTTYLKPLRDAQSEFIPKKNSRLSQILQEHEAFKGKENSHDLVKAAQVLNESIEKYFEGKQQNGVEDSLDQKGKELKDEIDGYIRAFYDDTKKSKFNAGETTLKNILEKLELEINDDINPGLGTLNRLFMASELLHLQKQNGGGLRLGLIEEMEAHLHPQAQMRVIEALQEQKNIQLILTTHSPNLASKVKLDNLIICNNKNAFPMGKVYTQLDKDDYKFLENFLDVTKSNLFFAKGVILVEGWAEEILLPSLAKKIGINLTEKGVSIVNVGSTAFFRYSKIFQRANSNENFKIPVSIVTDLDVKPNDSNSETKKQAKTTKLEEYACQVVRLYISPEWTLEWCLYKSSSVGTTFQEIVKTIHSGTDWDNFEAELTKKLLNKGLDKTEIAYKLAQKLDEDNAISINSNDEEDTMNYLIKAIKYACAED